MRISVAAALGVLVLSALVIGWSELYYPAQESLGTDVIALARQLFAMRSEAVQLRAAIPKLGADIQRLRPGVTRLTSRFPVPFANDLYIVVNTSANRLFLRRGDRVLSEARVSTGSNDTLAQGAHRWIFDTPRGVRTVIRKKQKPVWIKPDWAFLEAGETVPPIDSPLRRQRGVLGDYLLDVGAGVAIHGTNAEHLLGRSVTHGCIRVGRDDLKLLYDSVPLGTRVYIY